MKKIILGFICTFFVLASNAQKTSVSDLAEISLPDGAEKLSQSKLQEITKGNSAFAQVRNRDVSKADFYRLDKMILQLKGEKVKAPVSVEDFKKKMDGLMMNNDAQRANYVSDIRTVNNYKVLVYHFQGRDYAYFGFYGVDNIKSRVLDGKLEYDKKGGKAAAEATLNKILKSVKFK